MDGTRVRDPIETPLKSGGSRRNVVAGLLAAVVAAHVERGETAAAKRRSRWRSRRRGAVCRGRHDDTELVVTGVTASGESVALLPGRTSEVRRYNISHAWPKGSDDVVASGTVILPDGRPLEFSGPIDLARSAGSCDRLQLVIGPLDLVAPGEPVEIALLIPAIQAAREAARRRLCRIGRLLEQGGSARELAGNLNALIPLLTCSKESR